MLRLPAAGGVRFGIDCQIVVSGFTQRLLIADDDRAVHAGTWRLVNEAISRGPNVVVEVFMIKAHRSGIRSGRTSWRTSWVMRRSIC